MKRHHHLTPQGGRPGTQLKAQHRGMERRGQDALININPKKYCDASHKSGRGFLKDLWPLEMSRSTAPPLLGGHFGVGKWFGGVDRCAWVFFREGMEEEVVRFYSKHVSSPPLSVPSFLPPPAARRKQNG